MAEGGFEMTEHIEENTAWRRSVRGQRIDAVCWGLFFIWIGVVLMVKTIPQGVGALGVGGIILGGAVARRIFRASTSSFWIIIGAIFLLAGIGGMLAIDLPFLPVALIVCGILLLLHKRSRRRSHHHR